MPSSCCLPCAAIARALGVGPLRPERVTLVTWGSRGDVQPVIALALAMQRLHVKVQLLVQDDLGDFAKSFGLDVELYPNVVRFDAGAAMEWRQGADMRHVRSLPMSKAIFQHVATFAPDLLLHNWYLRMEAWVIEEELGVCTLEYSFCLGKLSSEDVELMMKDVSDRKFEMETFLGKSLLQTQSHSVQRKLLGTSRPVLFAASPTVAHAEESWPEPSPSAGVHVTGYWVVDSAVQDDSAAESSQYFGGPQAAELRDFLNSGEPPVYVGWGSMHVKSPGFMSRMAARSLMKAKKRGIILANAGMGPADLRFTLQQKEGVQLSQYAKDNVLWLHHGAAHELLMPLCDIVVHHGGCGTTAASLRSGKPTVVTPVAYDQIYWGKMVKELGVGVTTPRLAGLSDFGGENTIAQAILACEEQDVRKRAEDLAKKLRAEDGAATAAAFVEKYVRNKVHTGKWRECCLAECGGQ